MCAQSCKAQRTGLPLPCLTVLFPLQRSSALRAPNIAQVRTAKTGLDSSECCCLPPRCSSAPLPPCPFLGSQTRQSNVPILCRASGRFTTQRRLWQLRRLSLAAAAGTRLTKACMKHITRVLRKKEVAPTSSVRACRHSCCLVRLANAVAGAPRGGPEVGTGHVSTSSSEPWAPPTCASPCQPQTAASEVALSDGSMTAIEAAEDAECRATWGVSLEQVGPPGQWVPGSRAPAGRASDASSAECSPYAALLHTGAGRSYRLLRRLVDMLAAVVCQPPAAVLQLPGAACLVGSAAVQAIPAPPAGCVVMQEWQLVEQLREEVELEAGELPLEWGEGFGTAIMMVLL